MNHSDLSGQALIFITSSIVVHMSSDSQPNRIQFLLLKKKDSPTIGFSDSVTAAIAAQFP